jgi:serine/threonine protein kinase
LSAKWGDNLELGSKIAEGGQAEIFEVEGGVEMQVVVKAFKKGYSLCSLQVQWSLGMPAGLIFVGTVLRDDTFAFVMQRYWGDLRKLIDAKMQRGGEPPFPEPQAIAIMSQIANGMEQLHRKEIPHRG